MKKLFTLFLLSFSLLHAGVINIALAANVSYAIDDLKAAFCKHYPDTEVKITLGGSGKLTAQITHGAPYDIFMSANMRYPKALYEQKIALTQPKIYAKGALAILSLRPRDFTKGIDIVTEKNIRRIAIANPQTAPYGKASVEALKNAKLYNKVKSKFIYGESIAQTVTYAVTAADLGFIAKSALFSSKMRRFKKGRNWTEVDAKLYTPIAQGIVILQRAQNNPDAKHFYDFILSDEAKAIFKKYGYNIS
ncbi:MAG TPA: molybdate ABC transporter substrate-binding protein [Sulfurimonas autotrophica]|uniref:Molybdate ABC transporter substrate-binding protein n=1 Tax=Sulfurimonas autotrophica TaxID=202747 RepID=A0A7C3G920_9BACT|nr:molybdate ABC transporter substrate-binding protein [Sulfurimonas autotrophica]